MATVSVVVPVYNAARYLPDAVDSVLRQSYADWELLLADDGSRDDSAAIAADYARRFAPRVRLLRHPGGANRGVSATRNLAIAHAAGRYVAFLDADDVWLPERLAEQVPVLEGRPEVGFVFGRAVCVDGAGRPLTRPTGPYRIQGELGFGFVGEPFAAYEHFLCVNIYAPVSTVLVRRELLRQVGGFPLRLKYQVEDMTTWTRIARSTLTYYVPRPLALYRVHDASWSGRQSPLSVVDAHREYLLRVAGDGGAMDGVLADNVLRLIPRYLRLADQPWPFRVRRSLDVLASLQRHRFLLPYLSAQGGRVLRKVRRLIGAT